MMLQITGNLRSVANSAWVSTLDETKASEKSDQEVLRVTSFLVKEHHTTPFESVTLTYSFSDKINNDSVSIWSMAPFIGCKYAKFITTEEGMSFLTIDLHNFIKVSKTSFEKDDYKEKEFWKLFESQDPLLASVVEGFNVPPEYDGGVEDVSNILGENKISVELIEVHNAPVREHVRATWRVGCPLSIAVQILRHRTGNFNMASGRYRTLSQDIVDVYDDIDRIHDKVIESMKGLKTGQALEKVSNYDKRIHELLSSSNDNSLAYKAMMTFAKEAKEAGAITLAEYKRFREFARYVLPEGRMTELYCTFYLPDFINYLQLRDSPHAQTEHVYVAQQMKRSLNVKLPDNFKIKSKYI